MYSHLFCPVFEDSLKCLYQNGLCQHFCDGSGEKRKCSCADGYRLGEDGRTCVADGRTFMTLLQFFFYVSHIR